MSKKAEIVLVRRKIESIEYETVSIDSYFGLNGNGMSNGAIKGEKALSHSFLLDTLRKVMGKTLTVIDSSITDRQQNKAIKDLIRNIISDEIEFSSGFAFDQNILTKMAENHFKDKTDEEINSSSISIEDALGINVDENVGLAPTQG